jgi:Prokaryotic N-terminal methylation motif
MTEPCSPSPFRRAGGFTLIELLVVISINDSISSWPNGGAANLYGALPSYYVDTATITTTPTTLSITENLSFTAAAQLGVWQKLATRAGGEAVSSDSY